MIKLNNGNGGGGASNFQWSSTEQVWPFELWNDGSTLYCKEINIGLLANASNVAYPLTSIYSGLTAEKVHSFSGVARNGVGRIINIPHPNPAPHEVAIDCLTGNLYVTTASNAWIAYTGYIKVVYKH